MLSYVLYRQSVCLPRGETGSPWRNRLSHHVPFPNKYPFPSATNKRGGGLLGGGGRGGRWSLVCCVAPAIKYSRVCLLHTSVSCCLRSKPVCSQCYFGVFGIPLICRSFLVFVLRETWRKTARERDWIGRNRPHPCCYCGSYGLGVAQSISELEPLNTKDDLLLFVCYFCRCWCRRW